MWVRIIEPDGVPTVAEAVSFDPATRFTPEIAALFQPAEEGMVYRARKIDGVWVAPPAPSPAPEPSPPEPTYRTKLSRPEFKLQFTGAERIAIRQARGYEGDDAALQLRAAIIDDFFDIVEDPALTYIDLELAATIEGVGYLESEGLIAAGRAAEILSGKQEA